MKSPGVWGPEGKGRTLALLFYWLSLKIQRLTFQPKGAKCHQLVRNSPQRARNSLGGSIPIYLVWLFCKSVQTHWFPGDLLATSLLKMLFSNPWMNSAWYLCLVLLHYLSLTKRFLHLESSLLTHYSCCGKVHVSHIHLSTINLVMTRTQFVNR